MSEILLKASNLTKRFGDLTAVDDLSINLDRGEIYGLVGPDGAGKTTTIRMMVGAMTPDSGEVHINGINMSQNPDLARENLGYLSQRFSLYEDMTVLENIRFFSEVRGLTSEEWEPRSMEILSFVGMAEFKDRLAGKLSGGMKQKLGLATALVHRPALLLLDEPSGGVDPVTRQDFWQLIIRIVAHDGVGVLVSTPYMDEVARCTKMGMMLNGRIILQGNPDEIPEKLSGQIIELEVEQLRKFRQLLDSIPGIEDVHTFGDRLHIRVSRGISKQIIKDIRAAAKENDFKINAVKNVDAQLEDVFISLLNHEQDKRVIN